MGRPIVVINVPVFIDVMKKINDVNKGVTWGPVTYMDDTTNFFEMNNFKTTINLDMALFCKMEKYNNQREFRVIHYGDSHREKYSLELGSEVVSLLCEDTSNLPDSNLPESFFY